MWRRALLQRHSSFLEPVAAAEYLAPEAIVALGYQKRGKEL